MRCAFTAIFLASQWCVGAKYNQRTAIMIAHHARTADFLTTCSCSVPAEPSKLQDLWFVWQNNSTCSARFVHNAPAYNLVPNTWPRD